MEHSEEANQKGKEIVAKFLSEGYDMEEATLKAQMYCAEMTVKDKDNIMLWAMAGIYCTIAAYRLDGYDI